MELLDVQPRKEEELVNDEAEQQGATEEERDGRGRVVACRGWTRRSCSRQGMDAVEL
jgi:hypothetical protein